VTHEPAPFLVNPVDAVPARPLGPDVVVAEAADAPVPDGVDRSDLAGYCLRLGDDALVLAHRLSEWTAHAPELEEDVALANIALDLLGQARVLLTRAAAVEPVAPGAARRDEDALAFLRSDREYRNVQLVELANGDFARTIARQLAFSTYQWLLYRRLESSADPVLSGVAAKAVKEAAYHVDHAVLWTLRLGDGTAESHRRLEDGVEAVWPYTAELFKPDPLTERMVAAGVGVDPAALRDEWRDRVGAALTEATLAVPDDDWDPTGWAGGGGRQGVHTEQLGYVLAEMQSLHRAHPGARW
jgi:ring-1,2-phenylacetyl-CoA epoxidase subunit PaaC